MPIINTTQLSTCYWSTATLDFSSDRHSTLVKNSKALVRLALKLRRYFFYCFFLLLHSMMKIQSQNRLFVQFFFCQFPFFSFSRYTRLWDRLAKSSVFSDIVLRSSVNWLLIFLSLCITDVPIMQICSCGFHELSLVVDGNVNRLLVSWFNLSINHPALFEVFPPRTPTPYTRSTSLARTFAIWRPFCRMKQTFRFGARRVWKPPWWIWWAQGL